MKTSALRLSTFVILALFHFSSVAQQNEFKDMINRYLDNYYSENGLLTAYVSADKYLYEKGEDIWYTTLLLNRFTNLPPQQDKTLTLKLFRGRTEAYEKQLQLKNGMANGNIPLTDYFSEGRYTLEVYSSNNVQPLFRREIEVRDHAIPFHLVSVDFPKKYYQGGEKIAFSVSATDYFKNPLKNAGYNYILMNGKREAFHDRGKLDKAGTASLSVSLPNPIASEGLTFVITVEDKNLSESLSFDIPSQSENVSVSFYPQGGNLTANLPNKVMLKAVDKYGHSFPFGGVVYNKKGEKLGEVSSDESGLAQFNFTPSAHEDLKLQITTPYLINKEFSFPTINATGAGVYLVDQTPEFVKLRISQFPAVEKINYLGMISKGEMYDVKKITLKDNYDLELPSATLKPGLNRITLFSPMMVPVSETLVYVGENRQNKITGEFVEENYENRQSVVFNINAPKDLYRTFSAVDEYRLISEEPLPNLASHLMIGTELQDDPTIDPQVLNSPVELNKSIDQWLSCSYPSDGWDDIYASNNKTINFRDRSGEIKDFDTPFSLGYKSIENGHIICSNFPHEIYYLANNPVLIDKLKELKKTQKQEPFYKDQLRNGVSLREVIKNIKNYDVMGDKIVFPGTQNSLNFQGGALIVLDGIKLGESITALDQINPFDVDEITISTNPGDIHRYTGLNSVGIIDIKTKRGMIEQKETPDFNKEFHSPDYSKNEKIERDLRSTIFYSPFQLKTDFPEKISFYHSDIRTKVIGRLEGIDAQGNAFYKEDSYASYNYSTENQ